MYSSPAHLAVISDFVYRLATALEYGVWNGNRYVPDLYNYIPTHTIYSKDRNIF